VPKSVLSPLKVASPFKVKEQEPAEVTPNHRLKPYSESEDRTPRARSSLDREETGDNVISTRGWDKGGLQAPRVTAEYAEYGFSESGSVLSSPRRVSCPTTPRKDDEECFVDREQGWFADLVDSLLFRCCACADKSGAYYTRASEILLSPRKDSSTRYDPEI